MFCLRRILPMLTLCLGILVLAACRPAFTPTPSPTPVPTATAPAPNTSGQTVDETVALVKAFVAAWDARDPDALLAFYAHDVRSYDANSGGQFMDYLTLDDVLHHDLVNGVFTVKFSSFFVSDNGRFGVMVGAFTQKVTDNTVTRPYVSLLEFKLGKIIRVIDYYGGESAKGLPMQVIPASASQPASSSQAVTDVKTMVADWETAYNNKNAQSLLAFYAEGAQWTQVTSPEWRIFTKATLNQEVRSSFGNPKFTSGLSSFVVSADGRFAAVQGMYADDKNAQTPMIIILEIDNGKIVQQYDYLVLAH